MSRFTRTRLASTLLICASLALSLIVGNALRASAIVGSSISSGQNPVARRLYVAANVAALPTCDAATDGQVAFTFSPIAIVACIDNGWGTAQFFIRVAAFYDADTTAQEDERYLNVDATGAARVITLPDCANIHGYAVSVKKIDASGNAVTITPAGAQTIDGAATLPLAAQWDQATVVCGSCLADGDDNWCVH